MMSKRKSNHPYFKILDELSRDFADPPIIPEDLIQSIREKKPLSEIDFDRIYPPRIRALSETHWSSMNVAQHIADMLKDQSQARFIDIGSGVGKLCTLLGILTDMKVYGLEQRQDLYKISRTVAEKNNLTNVHFIHGNMLDLSWSDYDIFYLYNPFQEHMYAQFDVGLVDNNIDLDRKYYVQYVSEVFRQLTWLEVGKKVITFHGYGGHMPLSMQLLDSRHVDNGELCLWEKQIEKA